MIVDAVWLLIGLAAVVAGIACAVGLIACAATHQWLPIGWFGLGVYACGEILKSVDKHNPSRRAQP